MATTKRKGAYATAARRARRPLAKGDKPAEKNTEWLVVSRLKVDHNYQREIAGGRVKEIVDNFDPDLIGTFTVSQRSTGTYYLLDGQTRQAALIEMGWGDQKVPCLVYQGLARKDEARIFVGANITATKPNAYAIFKAKLAAGDPETIAIAEIAAKNGYTKVGRHDMVMSPAALTRIYQKGGPDALDATLRVTAAAWPGAHVNAPFLQALAMFLVQFGSAINQERLVTLLAKSNPDIMVSRARALTLSHAGRIGGSLLQVLVADYNNRLRGDRLLYNDVPDNKAWVLRSVLFVRQALSA